MPRAADGVSLEDTYPELLAALLDPSGRARVWNRSGGALTVTPLLQRFRGDLSYFSRRERTVLILQYGVVDCAPRPLPKLARALLSRAPERIRTPIVGWLNRMRPRLLRAGFTFRMTAPGRFSRLTKTWLEEAQQEFDHILLMGIAPTNPETEAHSPGFAASIAEYNRRLRDEVIKRRADNIAFVDIEAAIADARLVEMILADGHHLTAAAHRLYAERAFAAIRAQAAAPRRPKARAERELNSRGDVSAVGA